MTTVIRSLRAMRSACVYKYVYKYSKQLCAQCTSRHNNDPCPSVCNNSSVIPAYLVKQLFTGSRAFCRSTFVKALSDLGSAVTGDNPGIQWSDRFRYVCLCPASSEHDLLE